jgi:exopolysaccharide biosynthesis polyprenyl glycosylphosphotransferase
VRWLVIGEQDRLDMIRRDAERGPPGLELLFPPGGIESISGMVLANPGVEVRFRDRAHRVEDIDGVVLATDRALPDKLVTDLMHVRLAGVPVLESTNFYEHQYLRVPVLQLKDHWFALSEGFGLLHHESQMRIKRALDVTIAAVFLAFAAPLMLLTAVLVRLTSAGPALYSQIRCGQHGREFTLYKFRTMVRDAEADGARWAQPDDPRVTGLGRWLRRLRLDELPQLWNVLSGDMSFIGPRPERPDFVAVLEKEIPYYELRHLVKPGLTGWAQVMYGYGLSVEDAKNKLEYDLYYIKNYSLALDVYIMFRTARVVLSRLGV